jgi:hypothetical protein
MSFLFLFKGFLIFSSVLCLVVVAFDPGYYDPAVDAAEREEYYQNVIFDYENLHVLLNKTHIHHLSYDTARHKYLYPIVDRYPDQMLRGVYTNISFEPIPQPALYNCEHIVPQSWFYESSVRLLIILFRISYAGRSSSPVHCRRHL